MSVNLYGLDFHGILSVGITNHGPQIKQSRVGFPNHALHFGLIPDHAEPLPDPVKGDGSNPAGANLFFSRTYNYAKCSYSLSLSIYIRK